MVTKKTRWIGKTCILLTKNSKNTTTKSKP